MSVVTYKGENIGFDSRDEKFHWSNDPNGRGVYDTLADAKKAVDRFYAFKRFPALYVGGYDTTKVEEVTITSGTPDGSFWYVDEKGNRNKMAYYNVPDHLFYDTPENRVLLDRFDVLERAIQEFKTEQKALLKKAKHLVWKGHGKEGHE